MNKGLLIYTPEDFNKNTWFANQLIKQAASCQLSLQLVLTSDLILGIDHTGLYAQSAQTKERFSNINFVINRSRDSLIGIHFEKMGCRVFNSSTVTEICNHKGKTHQLINSAGISSVPTILCRKKYFSPENRPLKYPVILKSISGHGGSEVFMLPDESALKKQLAVLPSEEFILQKPCSQPGVDIRVFTLGKEIIAAVKRFNPNHFKSNYSLGGLATAYTLTPDEQKLVRHILNLLDFDLVGIDFILTKEGKLLFNEIEDVVGTRTLYLNYKDIDIISLYLSYIFAHL